MKCECRLEWLEKKELRGTCPSGVMLICYKCKKCGAIRFPRVTE